MGTKQPGGGKARNTAFALGALGLVAFAAMWEYRWRRVVQMLMERETHAEDWVERALHDPLTNLPNRTLLRDRLEQSLVRAQRNETGVAILFIDLDDFKLINDEYGHLVGDQILIAAGERFRQHLRASDTAARLGGDEFVVLLDVSQDIDAVRSVAERLRTALELPLVLNPKRLMVNASIGVCHTTNTDVDPDDLLRVADHALLEAKRNGKNQVVIEDLSREMAVAGHHCVTES